MEKAGNFSSPYALALADDDFLFNKDLRVNVGGNANVSALDTSVNGPVGAGAKRKSVMPAKGDDRRLDN